MRGLRNAGNTCYFNAALQCLAFCPHLANYMLEGCEGDVHPKRKLAGGLALALARYMQSYWTSRDEGMADADEVYSAFVKACRAFQREGPHDAHEALTCLLDKVHEGLARLKPGPHAVCDHPAVARQPWLDSLKGSCSAVSEVFRGQLEVRIEADGYSSVVHEHFTSLSLSVSECTTLTRCIQAHMAPCTVPDFRVDECPTEARVSRRFTYLPRILIVHLNRFEGRHSPAKVEKFIDYPSELDLRAFTCSACDHHYQLFGVCMHRGTVDDGHYTACCEVKGRWFLMDDEDAAPMADINHIIQRDAYMLLYKRL